MASEHLQAASSQDQHETRLDLRDSNGRPATAKSLTWYQDLRKHWALYLMAMPAIVAILLFGYRPLIGLLVAFQDFSPLRGIFNSTWVGLDNFRTAFQNPFFATAIRNTLIINGLKLGIGFPSAVILALLLNEIRLGWFKRLVQTATILPYFISWVVAATMFRNILAPDGVINEILTNVFHVRAVIFLSDPQKFPILIALQDTWKFCGFFAVLYLAAMAGIDPTLYEAAMVDGADRWQQMWHITIPAIRPTMATLFVLLVGWLIQGGFEQIWVMYNPSVYSTGDVLETFTLRLALQQSKYGLATAIGLFQSIISIGLVLATNAAVKRFNKQGIF
ncbi:MAG TPA: ABC transporter permease subunit [Aggregatilineaceae bacterium]|nr:ABC transporter permease subunit [Aggregatilineaceae bacterium]